VGLGTYATFDRDAEQATKVVAAALDAGISLFDSSPMYGGAEASLGKALAGRRGDTVVATKIWARDVDEGRRQYDVQRRHFGRVEIEQVHNLVAWREHLAWLEEEKAGGRIDRLGVTHYAASAFAALEDAVGTRRFNTVQIPLSPLEREAERRILPLAAELGVAVIVMRPLGGTGAPLLRRDPGADRLAPLRPFGVETWVQALLAWSLADPRVDVVIPATASPEHVRENAAAGVGPRLGAEEREYVAQLATR
jgi:diketogulonate reductase-like aldo/keto reductase